MEMELGIMSRADSIELQKKPVDGFSAGLVDDDNILEWQIVIMGYVSIRSPFSLAERVIKLIR